MRRLGTETALWVGAVLGTLCLLATLASLVFGLRPLVFQSGSMAPAYEAGALGLAYEVPAREVRAGDVVSVVDRDGVRVTHRVIAAEDAGALTRLDLKGDANRSADPDPYLVTSVDKVVLGVPWVGYAVAWMMSTPGLLLGGFLVAGLLLVAFGPAWPSSARQRRRVAALVVTAGLIGTLAGGRGPVPTTAAWTDSATATSGGLAAMTVTPPASTGCSTAVLAATVSWPGDPRYDYEVTLRRDSNGSVVSTRQVTGSARSTTYTGLLDFGLVVGAGTVDFTVEIRSYLASAPQWRSSGTAKRSVRVLALLVGATVTCPG